MKHKWHKEIKAWANGGYIQKRVYGLEGVWSDWYDSDIFEWDDDLTEYRIKPQPKEPQYLYVYLDDDYEFSTIKLDGEWEYIGKIKLETEE